MAEAAGAEVAGVVSARVERPDPKYFIGTGKADELKSAREALAADLVLVNGTLTPVQERNLEALATCRVVDRTGLILDIFAQRARSHEGKLQVELAQLEHLSTRLVRGWTHLERQRGGSIGLRGPGETQLELDRRLIGEKIKQLHRRLDKVELQRAQSRRRRQRNALPVVALVGYTNAGKSTLFNALTGADAFVADQLFATLDPTVRRRDGLACGPILVADTVGFVRDLPHDLVAAFRATLAEAREADLLLHVVDAADPDRGERIADVDAVLAEIGADRVPQVLVFNKSDLLDVAPGAVNGSVSRLPFAGNASGRTPRVAVSALTRDGFDRLDAAIVAQLARDRVQAELRLPASAGRLRARLHARGVVAGETADDSGWQLRIDAPRAVLEPLYGLPGGDGEWLRGALLAASEGASYNPKASSA